MKHHAKQPTEQVMRNRRNEKSTKRDWDDSRADRTKGSAIDEHRSVSRVPRYRLDLLRSWRGDGIGWDSEGEQVAGAH